MTHLRVEKVSFGFAEILFKEVTFSINDYDRIGIVGNNGSGKSTLLKCIAGIIKPNEGRIICAKGLKFGIIEQDISADFYEINAYDFLTEAIPVSLKSSSLWRVDVTLDAFKAPASLKQKKIKELSGGWQRLMLIARTVMSSPDILLLDEPTNHLDKNKIVVLEKWLNEEVYDIPLITVSHDRNFLASSTNKTLFLKHAHVYEYPYSYEKAKQLLKNDEESALAQHAKEVKEIERLKRSAHELRQIGVNNYSDSALKKSNQISKRAEKIATQITPLNFETKHSIKLKTSDMQAKKLIEINDVNINSPNGVLLFHINHLEIKIGDRIVINGENGSGKSQFIKFIKKAIDDIDRARTMGVIITPTLKLGFLDQHLSHLPLTKTILDYFTENLPIDQQKITGMLVTAGFSIPLQRTKISALSYGQRARIAFLALHMIYPNFYVMDEPTNHLDIEGQGQLEHEILNQNAAAILVSHDRAFTAAIGTKYYTINNQELICNEDIIKNI